MFDEHDLYKVIKKIVRNVNDAEGPADFIFGVLKSTEPYKVQWGKIVLDDDFLEIPARFDFDTKSHKYNVEGGEGGTVTVKPKIKVGDKVVLLKKPGGQSFLLLDKVVTE